MRYVVPTSVWRLNSAGFILLVATAPDRLISPPTNALLPNAPYRNNRNVLQGAMDSVTNLFLIPSSRPPPFRSFVLLVLLLLLIDRHELVLRFLKTGCRDRKSDGLDSDDTFVVVEVVVVVVNAFPGELEQENSTTATTTRHVPRNVENLEDDDDDNIMAMMLKSCNFL